MKLETVASASASPDSPPTPVPKQDPLKQQSKDFLFEMSKGSGGSGFMSSQSASDVLYVCSASGLSSSSFSSVEKAKTAITEFLIQMSSLTNVPRSLYDEIADLLVNLKTRNSRWSALKFQLMTLPRDTSNGEVIALQA